MRFDTRELLHKWGFEDGDLLAPYLHAQGFDLARVDPNRVLEDVLKKHVLPAIRNRIEWHTLSTMHNPIRVTTVDSSTIDHMRVNHPEVRLEPDFVDVPDEAILEIASRG